MRLRFSKMHSLGEDLIVIDGLTQHARLTADMVRLLADRRLGVGCQQVLVVEAPGKPDMDFRMRLFNRDGSLASDYHRAAFCLAHFVLERRLTAKRLLQVETVKGPNITVKAQTDGETMLDLGVLPLEFSLKQQVDLDGQNHELSLIRLEQSHALVELPSVADAPLKALGRSIQQHPQIPAGVNVGFMAVLSRRQIDLRVLQHNGSEARACPGGAIAAVIAGRLNGQLDEEVNVKLQGGKLAIRWHAQGEPIQLSTEATLVYQGQIHL